MAISVSCLMDTLMEEYRDRTDCPDCPITVTLRDGEEIHVDDFLAGCEAHLADFERHDLYSQDAFVQMCEDVDDLMYVMSTQLC